MKQTVYFDDFRRAFEDAGRGNQFSLAGLEVLFDYLEQYEIDTGEEVELDVIALCCDYEEMTVDEVISYYDLDDTDCEDEADRHTLVSDYLNDNTALCGEVSPNGYLFASF